MDTTTSILVALFCIAAFVAVYYYFGRKRKNPLMTEETENKIRVQLARAQRNFIRTQRSALKRNDERIKELKEQKASARTK